MNAPLSPDLIWHPYTKRSAIDAGSLPVIVRGDGPYLYDQNGTRYLDAISSWWACSLGHGHPTVVQAIQEQAGQLQHSILGNLSHENALRLAQELVELTGGHRHVHFASDGASAIEASLKIAVQYWTQSGQPQRTRFASLSDPYHGDTLGAVSVGYMEAFHRPFRSLLFDTVQLPFPHCAGCRASNNPQACDAPCFADTEAILRRQAKDLAAVIVEPLCQGAAGMRMYGPAWLRRLSEVCRELDVLVIVDEVATGFCKTGKWFAYQHADIDPDIICVGKGLSAGYLPISAAIVQDRLYNAFGDDGEDHTFYHGHTFAGNPIAAAAARAAISVYRDDDLATRARAIGRQMQDRLSGLGDLPQVQDVRFLGAIAAIELAVDARPERVRDRMVAAGVLARPMGRTMYLMPPLIATDEIIQQLCDRLEQAVRQEC